MEQKTDHLKSVQVQVFLVLSILAGLAALFFTFAVPSETRNASFGAYSVSRWMLGLATAVLILCFVFLLIRERRTNSAVTGQINAFLSAGDWAYFVFLAFCFGLFISLWMFKFSWLFIPKNLRPQLLWSALVFLSGALILFTVFRKSFKAGNVYERYRLFPKISDLSGIQKKTLIVLCVIGLAYIIILLPSNRNGSKDWDDFRHYGGDEYVIYPILQNVANTGHSYSEWLYHHYIHEDYHYGYPFYALSWLVLQPVHLIIGPDYMQRIDLTLPTLRTMVSVVPMMFGCMILVFMTTRFIKPLVSAAAFVFLLTAPGSLQNNQGFWHPDGLNLFFLCLRGALFPAAGPAALWQKLLFVRIFRRSFGCYPSVWFFLLPGSFCQPFIRISLKKTELHAGSSKRAAVFAGDVRNHSVEFSIFIPGRCAAEHGRNSHGKK